MLYQSKIRVMLCSSYLAIINNLSEWVIRSWLYQTGPLLISFTHSSLLMLVCCEKSWDVIDTQRNICACASAPYAYVLGAHSFFFVCVLLHLLFIILSINFNDIILCYYSILFLFCTLLHRAWPLHCRLSSFPWRFATFVFTFASFLPICLFIYIFVIICKTFLSLSLSSFSLSFCIYQIISTEINYQKRVSFILFAMFCLSFSIHDDRTRMRNERERERTEHRINHIALEKWGTNILTASKLEPMKLARPLRC